MFHQLPGILGAVHFMYDFEINVFDLMRGATLGRQEPGSFIIFIFTDMVPMKFASRSTFAFFLKKKNLTNIFIIEDGVSVRPPQPKHMVTLY